MATTRKSTNKTTLVKLTTYSFAYGYIHALGNGKMTYRTTEKEHRVITNTKEKLFDTDIHCVSQERMEILNIEAGCGKEGKDDILVDYEILRSLGDVGLKERSSQYHNTTPYLVLSPSHFKTVTFYKITFKTAIPTGLGINGISFDHTIYIDEPSYKHLCEYIDGDVL